MIEKLRARLCAEAAQWHKLWSTWLAVVWGLIVTAIWNDPDTLQSLVNALPDQVRALLSPLVLGLIAGLPILVRLLKQNLGGKQ